MNRSKWRPEAQQQPFILKQPDFGSGLGYGAGVTNNGYVDNTPVTIGPEL
jgi:hypothetical protein